MKEIALSNGMITVVDDDDYQELSKYKWGVMQHRNTCYARRIVTTLDGKQQTIFMHRIVAKTPDGYYTDHIDGDGLNNTKANLRICTNQQNLFNRPSRWGSSIYKGVSWSNRYQKWSAFITRDGKSIYLGRYERELDAATAYDAAARELFGDYARLNIVSQSE